MGFAELGSLGKTKLISNVSLFLDHSLTKSISRPPIFSSLYIAHTKQFSSIVILLSFVDEEDKLLIVEIYFQRPVHLLRIKG